jgi:hypothetical protein
MFAKIPYSLLFFVATLIAFLLQMIPMIGIVMMFAGAFLWSAVLINLGMLGVALEALIGRVSRWWLLLPLAYFGGYAAFTMMEKRSLSSLTAELEKSNSAVLIPFNPDQQALVFETPIDDAERFVQEHDIPLTYQTAADKAEGFISYRVIDQAFCQEVRQSAIRKANVISILQADNAACSLVMPERPTQPQITVSTEESQTTLGSLPIIRLETTVKVPDGTSQKLVGGYAAPLSWFPLPFIGCGLNSGAPSWDCTAEFSRNIGQPLLSAPENDRRTLTALARSLGLRAVPALERKPSDANMLREKLRQLETKM